MSKAILVTGATGKQGGAAVNALVASNADIEILAVTRNPNSPGAQKLAQTSPKIKLVQGDLTDPARTFANAKIATSTPIWGVFSVSTNTASNSKNSSTFQIQSTRDVNRKLDPEELQGINLIDTAIKENVKFFVFTSVDRHGDKSTNNPTSVPHFISKHNIEQHLFQHASQAGIGYTVLRPTAFMDNALGGFGKMFGTLWNTRPKNMKLQLIAASDIGYFAAQAFLNPESEIYKNKCISLAGDELTFEEAKAKFREVANMEFPTTFSLIGYGLLMAVADLRLMFKWFETEGYAADIEGLRKIHPRLKNFTTWLNEESGYVKK
ncbi:NmrA-like family protein [Pseudovirgaria hyperparasitica]|uniref:NmrA-like family protein n=1 Tax=Pseudovirgaria hyperparasitica TaxID=470096 RepID=A0A6A6WL60_9PEZI|nr:NmrA-like family protein [Pseudovirgaria hyperparasitica]KAF2762935.1 NmrA-like family protein [Pseudovirgaria hyperparasitica]